MPGFIGSNLVLRLLDGKEPVRVIGLDNVNSYYDPSLKEYRLRVIAQKTEAHPEHSYTIGANVRESKHAQSGADFLSKMSIAYKEVDETDFWLNLLHDNGYLNDDQFNSLNKDIDRILKVLASIVKTMKEKIEDGKRK